jgi:trimeric autotransporter adhesin
VNLSANSTSATGWTWSGPSGFSSTLQNPSDVPTVTGTYLLALSNGTGSGCTPATVYTTSVTVNAAPSSSGATNDGPICVGGTVNLSANSTGATGWSWSGPSGFSSTLQNPSATPTTTGTYSLTVSSTGSGCSPATVYTTSVTVNPLPGSITGTTSACTGSTTNLTDAGGGTWTSSNTSIATVGTSNGVVTGVAAGTVDITYTLSTGCSATTVVTITTTPAAISGTPSACVGYISALTDAGGGTWSSSNTSVATVGTSTGIVTGVAAGTTTISYTLPCGTVTTTFTVITSGTAPTVSGVSPTSGIPGGSVTVNGSGFNITPADNIVYFGATQGTVTAATSTSLTVTIPIGATHMPVFVENSGCGLAGYAQYPFTPVYNNSAYVAGTINFDPVQTFTTSTSPYDVTIADLDGDGLPDLAVTNIGSNTVSIFRNTATSGAISSSSFASKVDFTTGTQPYCVVASDVDGDGKPDLIVSNEVSNTISVLRNTATSGSITSGSFASKVDFTTGTNPVSLAVGDIDQDGKTDIVVANFASNTVSVFRNTATYGTITSSSFAAKVDFTTGTHPFGVALGDIDGDGKPEVVVPNQGSNTVSVFRNTATSGSITSASLVAKVDFTTGTQPVYAGLADIDGDGKLDIAVANSISRTISVYRNTASSGSISSSSLAAKVDFTAGVLPLNIAFGDIDGDGKVDMVVSHQGNTTRATSRTVSIFRNTASSGSITSGSFAALVDEVMASSPRFVAVGDLDGDTQPDVVVSLVNDNTIAVLRYNSIQPITGTTFICGLGGTTTLADATSGGSWSSSNTSVATVGTGTGVVTAVSSGTTIITYAVSGGDFVTTTVTTTAAPSAISGTTSVCIGSTTTLTDATSGGTWTSGTTTVATIGSGTGVVTGVASGTTIVTYSLGTGCTVTETVTVNPSVILGSTAACVGVTVTLSDAGGGTWSSSNTGIADVGTATGDVTGISAGTATITYSVSGCSATTSFTVIASPGAISGNDATCIGTTTTLADAGGGTWSSSDNSIATVGSGTGVVSGVAAGTAVISYSLGASCSATTTVTISAMPGSITGTTSVCPVLTTTLTDATPGGTWSSASTSIATVGSATGVVTGVSAGTTTITYSTGGSGCIATTTVTVNASPSSVNGTMYACEGSSTTLTDATAGGTWTSGTTSVATVGSGTGAVTGVLAGTSVITYTVAGGCVAVATYTVNPMPASITGTTSVCIGSSTALNDAGGGDWVSSDITKATVGSTTGLVTGVAAGTTTISYTLSTGCMTTTVVTVNSLPTAISGTTQVCEGATASLTDPDGGTWSSSDVTIVTVGPATGTISGVASGTATITFTATTGCAATITVTVNALPGSISGATTLCSNSATTLTDATPGGTWTSSTTSVATAGSATGVISGVSAGTSTISYTLSTGCYSTAVVTVNPAPSAITGTASVCVGSTTALTDAGGGTWSSSDATIADAGSSTGIVTGIGQGTATISYSLSTGCTVTAVVTVNALPAAISGSGSVCVGLTTTYTDATTGGTWTSGTTGVATIGSSSGIVTGVASGTSTITYTLSTGCTTTSVITVNAVPASISGTAVVCESGTVTLTDATAGGTWSSSNTTAALIGSSSGTVTGVTYGTSVISYTLGTGCYSTTVATVNLLPAGISGSSAVCSGSTLTLSDGTAGGTWSSSNTSAATVGSSSGIVSGVAVGTTTISYILSTGCYSTLIISVNAVPSAITGSTFVCSGLTTALNNATPGGTWSSSNTSVATVATSSGVVTGVSTGTTVISYTMTCGTVTTTVTVGGVAAGAPTVTSVSPSAGYPASSVTIAGTNFNTVPANNIVYFGATQATVTAASTTSLTVTVPAGATYMPVSVDNTGCALTGYSTYPFTPDYNNSAYVANTVNFSSKTDFTSGASPYSVAIGDIDGDGKADVAVTNLAANTISVFRNTSSSGSITSGSFATKVDFTTGSSPYSAVLGDVDGDGKLDLVVANEASNTVSVLRNTASSGSITSGSFASKVDFATGTNPISIAIADIDMDGKPDLVTANFYSNTVSVLRNTVGSGISSSSFAAKVDFATATHPYSVAVGDLDGDGLPDIAVANQGSASVSVLRNTSASGTITSSSIAAKVDFTTGTNPYYVALADIDGDGKLDIAVVNNSSNSISIFRNTASSGSITSGSFTAKVDFTTGASPYNVSAGDIDGDGKVDLAVANATSNTVSIFRNTASSGSITSGSLAAKVDFATGSSPRFVAIGDLDGDYLPDLAVANFSANTVSIIRNNPMSPISGTASVCAGGSTSTLSDATSGGTWSSSNTSVATVGSGTGVVTGVATGTATISYTLAGGSATVTVTVGTAPSAISGTAAVCAGATVTLTDATSSGTWSSGATGVATVGSGTGVVSGVSAGTSIITYALSATCYVTKTATVNALPSAISGASSVCSGVTTTLTDATAGGTWTSSATSVATIGSGTGVATGVTAGSTTITYTISSTGCYATSSLTVISSPAAISGATGLCVGVNTTLTDATGGGTWSSSNTSVATIGSSTGVAGGVATGTATITYAVSSGCTALSTIAVNTVPGSISGSSSVCAGSTATLTDATSGGTWSSGATSVATIGSATGIVSGVTAGTTTITYSIGSACATTTTVTINGIPTITSLSSSAANPTTTVTITGTNFNTTAASNVVYFGATAATVSSASSTSLSVTVPTDATYMPVSVNNTGCNLVAYSQYPFLPTWDNSLYVPGSINFSSKVDFSTSTSPFYVAIGDIDGDGLADMVAVNQSSSTVSVFRNTSTSGTITSGSFAAKVDFTVGTSPYSLAIGDLDCDGKLDLAVVNNSGNTVSVLRNTATSGTISASSFATKVDFTTGTNPISVAIGDVDGDGKPEIVTANFYSGTASVFRNKSTSGSITSGSFAAKVDFTTATHPYSVALGDIDGDGKKDMVIANQGSASVSVFRNTATSGAISSSSFAAKVDFTTGTNPFSVAIGDIDGDGKMDVVVANNSSTSISVFRNTASSGSITSGSLASKVDFTTGSTPYNVSLGDIDGDGKVDVVVANAASNTVSIFRNTASSGTITSGSLAAKTDFSSGSSPRCVAVGDLDGDTKPDVVTANLTANTVSVLRNAAVHLAPPASNNGTVTLCAGAMVALNNANAGGDWSSSNSNVASVDPATGIVTAVAPGRTVVVYNTSAATYLTNIIVNPLPDAVVITAYPGTNIQKGQNVKLAAAVQNGGTLPVYQWQVNGKSVAGATTATFERNNFADNDVVTCVVSSATGCDGYSISNSVTIKTGNVDNSQVALNGSDIRILPNPNSGTFVIKGSLGASVNEEVTIEIVNVLGQVVYNNKAVAKSGRINEQVTLGGNLANGMYLLNLRTANDSKEFHMVLKK